MSSVQSLREFISERLSAAAEEIFTEFEKMIFHFDEKLNHQYRRLDITWKPQVNVHGTEVPQQHLCEEEEVVAHQQLCYKERNSNQDQHEPEPPEEHQEEPEPLEPDEEREHPEPQQIDEEQEHPEPPQIDEELCSNEQERLVSTQSHFQVLLPCTSKCEESLELIPVDVNQHREEFDHLCRQLDTSWIPQIRLHRIDLAQKCVCKKEERNSSLDQEEPELKGEQEQLVLKQETDTFMLTPTDQERDFSEAEPNTEQLYSQNCPLTERTDEEQSKNLDSGSTTDVEMNPKKRCRRSRTDDESVDQSAESQSQLNTQSGKPPVKCHFCGKTFGSKYHLLRHHRTHTGEKPYDCKICGKVFARKDYVLNHIRTHTGERPYSCQTCGKSFRQNYLLTNHMRTHSAGESL